MNKPAAKGSVVKTLLSNRALRRVVIRNARQAISYVSTTVAARTAARSGQKDSAASSSTRSDQSGSPSSSSTFSDPKPGANPASSMLSSEALSNFVSSVAKPAAEKMASSPAGRSVLQTLNKISSDALGTAPKGSDNPVAAFVSKLAAAANSSMARGAASTGGSGSSTDTPPEAKIKFSPLQPPAAPGAEPIKTIKWPPPKPANAAQANRSGTDSAPE